MYIEMLKEKFSINRKYTTEDLNELLDFAKKAYISNEISTSEYKTFVRELESRGAVMPHRETEELSQTEK